MTDDNVRLICFYLPQFHPVPENDARWGKGYSEWRNVVQARPLFAGHYQPHIPADLGFYDLRLHDTQIEQAELAARYGIYGFSYYLYWFAGKRLLSRPLEQIVANRTPDFPFCVTWANHDWHEAWCGRRDRIFLKQEYSEEDATNLIRYLIHLFADPRYIRINAKPLFIVYDTSALPNAQHYAAIWRAEVKAAGFEDLYLCSMETFGKNFDPKIIDFDAALEFPPHGARSIHRLVEPLDPSSGFPGKAMDYEQAAFYMLNKPRPDYRLFRCVFPSWDNTARRIPRDAWIFTNSSPEAYCQWLAECADWTRAEHTGDERLVFINGWNEWAEGAHLEPDLHYGHAHLQATLDALEPGASRSNPKVSSIHRATYRWGPSGLVDGNERTLTMSPQIVGATYKVWESADKLCVAGWACDLESPAWPVVVLLWAGQRLLAVERTFINQPDVRRDVHPDASDSGFHIELDLGLLEHVDRENLKIALVSHGQRYAIMPAKGLNANAAPLEEVAISQRLSNFLRSIRLPLPKP